MILTQWATKDTKLRGPGGLFGFWFRQRRERGRCERV